MRLNIDFDREKSIKSFERIYNRIIESARNGLERVGNTLVAEFNKSLTSRIIPGASPPQSQRGGDPKWIHVPIEEGWHVSVTGSDTVFELIISNESNHIYAVEYGVPHTITPSEKPQLVFMSSKLGYILVKTKEVRGQNAKGFGQAVLDEWRDKIPSMLFK